MSLKGTPYYDMACDVTSSEEEREQIAQMLYYEEMREAQEPPVVQCHKCTGRAWDLGDVIECENCGIVSVDTEETEEWLNEDTENPDFTPVQRAWEAISEATRKEIEGGE